MTQTNKRRWLMGVAVFVLTIGAVLMIRKYLGPSVAATIVEARDLQQRVVASGRIVPESRVSLGSQVLGVVKDVSVRAGDIVKQDQVLARLDDTEAQAQVAQARASLEQAEARFDQMMTLNSRVSRAGLVETRLDVQIAQVNLKRETELAAVNASTKESLEKVRHDLAVAKSRYDSAVAQAEATAPKGTDSRAAAAEVRRSEAALDLAHAKLAQTIFVAKSDGLILIRAIEPGDLVQPGTIAFVLSLGAKTCVEAQIDETNLALIAKGQKAATIADAYPDEPFDATVESIAPVVDPARGTVAVTFVAANPPAFLKPDMSVSVNIDTRHVAAAMAVPIAAVQDAYTSAPWVFVVVDNRLHRQAVSLGIRGDDFVELVSGVTPGAVVVLSTLGLADGQRVRTAAPRHE